MRVLERSSHNSHRPAKAAEPSPLPHWFPPLPPSWGAVIGEELRQPYFAKLLAFLEQEIARHRVFPPASEMFAALQHTPFERVRVVLLGQDPYPGAGQAHGLCFSVGNGVKTPGSLKNMLKELQADLGCPPPGDSACLTAWADQGVLLLNAVLTVRQGASLSHRGRGWEMFTDQIIRKLNDRAEPVVFALWGGQAQQKMRLIDAHHHAIVMAAHPSPLSAHRGFFGSRPFSRINSELRRLGQREIEWCLKGADE